MRASELLTLMGHLSVGNDNITPGERAIFLQYLNLAHLELYQETANFNPDLLIKENLANTQGSNVEGRLPVVTLSRAPYLISGVYDGTQTGSPGKRKLMRLSVSEAIENDPGLSSKGTPSAWFVQKNILSLVPAPATPMRVIVWYIPQPSNLTEDTEEADIPYPVAYHPVLTDGALYYLFQEEGGFKNSQKELEARKRWEAGKSKLLSYLYASSGQTFSTFSNV